MLASLLFSICLMPGNAAEYYREISVKRPSVGLHLPVTSRDGKFLAMPAGENFEILVWDIPNWKAVGKLSMLKEKCMASRELTFSEDSAYLMSWDNNRGILHCLWDPPKLDLVKRFQDDESFKKYLAKKSIVVAEAPAPPYVVKFGESYSDVIAVVRDGEEKRFKLKGIRSAVASADGKWIYAVSARDNEPARLHVLDSDRGTSRFETDAPANVDNIALIGDGSRLLTFSGLRNDAPVAVWETRQLLDAAAKARARSRQAVREAGPHAELMDAGIAFLEQGQFDKAQEKLIASIRAKPTTEGYLALGHALFAKGSSKRAAEAYSKTLELDPVSAPAHLYLGVAKMAAGDRKEAMRFFDLAVKHDPKLSLAYFNRGVLHQSAGKTDQAIAEYTRAAELDRFNRDAVAYRGITRFDAGRFDEAKADLEAVRYHPNLVVRRYLAAIYFKEGKIKEAKELLWYATQFYPKDAATWYQLGILCFKESNGSNEGPALIAIGQASTAFAKAAELEPGNVDYKRYAELTERAVIEGESKSKAAYEARMKTIRNTNQDYYAEMSRGLTNAALSIAAGANTGSGGGSYGAAESGHSGGTSGGYAPDAGAMPDPLRAARQANETVRKNLDRQLWDMNNPYRRR